MNSLNELFDGLKNGETVAIIHSPIANVYEPFEAILKHAESAKVPVLLVDVGDMLHVYKTNMRFFELDYSLVDQANVIKIGGCIDIGRIRGKLELEQDAEILISKYIPLLRKCVEELGYAIKILLGLDKLIALYSSNKPLIGPCFA